MTDALWVVTQTEVASHNMLEQAHRLRLNQLADHVTQHSNYSEESLVGMANVRQTCLVQQDLLDDENGDGLGEL